MPKGRILKPAERAVVLEKIKQGAKCVVIAIEHNIHASTVSRIATSNGIQRNNERLARQHSKKVVLETLISKGVTLKQAAEESGLSVFLARRVKCKIQKGG